jgi:hypothetical protein
MLAFETRQQPKRAADDGLTNQSCQVHKAEAVPQERPCLLADPQRHVQSWQAVSRLPLPGWEVQRLLRIGSAVDARGLVTGSLSLMLANLGRCQAAAGVGMVYGLSYCYSYCRSREGRDVLLDGVYSESPQDALHVPPNTPKSSELPAQKVP